MDGKFQHRLDCDRPDVHVTRGFTKALLRCRTCDALRWVPIAEVSS